MDFSALLRPEMITALSVSLGALLGGVVAVVAEFRKPEKVAKEKEKEAEAKAAVAESLSETKIKALSAVIREECDHVNRSVWIVEKKLGDRLHDIERTLAVIEGRR